MSLSILNVLGKLDDLDLKWYGTYDGKAVTDITIKAVVGIPIKLDTHYKLDGSEHHIIGLYYAGHGTDTIMLDDRQVDKDDVDFMVKIGFPKCVLQFNFEFTEGDAAHVLTLRAKIDIQKLVGAGISLKATANI